MSKINWYSFFNAYTQGIAGGDACFLNIAKAIEGSCQHTVITSELGRKLFNQQGIQADFLITSRETEFSHVYLIYARRIINVLVKFKPNLPCLLYATSDFLPDVWPAFWQKLLHRQNQWVQKMFHIIPEQRFVSSFLQKMSFFLIRRLADMIIVDNAGLKKDLVANHGFNPSIIYVIPPGINVVEIKAIKPAIERYQAIFLGQLRQSKGIFDLILIWRQVIEKYRTARLAVIGENIGDNQKQLLQLIKANNLSDNISILGFLERERVFALIKSADMLVLPSYEEGFGMVVVEAMICGKKTIAYDLPVFHEHFDNKIELIDKDNQQKFAQAVIMALDDPKKFNHEDFKPTYMKFDTDAVVRKELNLIHRLLPVQIA